MEQTSKIYVAIYNHQEMSPTSIKLDHTRLNSIQNFHIFKTLNGSVTFEAKITTPKD